MSITLADLGLETRGITMGEKMKTDNFMSAKLAFEATGWGCQSAVENLADRLNLSFIYKNKGGCFIFEYINGKVRGGYLNIVTFRDSLNRMFN